jgi:hypothetical protein
MVSIMKASNLFFLLLLLIGSFQNQAQKSKITFMAGYSQTTASAYKYWALASKKNYYEFDIFHKPGYFVGSGLSRGKFDFEVIYVNNRMLTDTNSFKSGVFYDTDNNPTKVASLNYLQLSFLRKKNIWQNLSFKYGLAGNINLKTQTTYEAKDYDKPSQTLEWKTKGLSLSEGVFDYPSPSIKENINVVPITLNFASRLNYHLDYLDVFFAYNIGLTKAVFDPSLTSLNFYYSSLNLGINTNLRKSKKI